MTTSRTETHGVRQLAVLATVAACIALAALLVGAVITGLADLGNGVLLVLISLAFVGGALFTGWIPGLYLGVVTLGVGALIAGDDFTWVRAMVLAVTIAVVHEASRFSLDARKPTRLGAGLLLRTSLGSLVAGGVAITAGVVIRGFLTGEPSLIWVPVALAAIALPLFAARFFELVLPRFVSRPQGPNVPVMLLLSGSAAVAVVVIVALGAQQRATATRSVTAPVEQPELTSTQLTQLRPEQVSGSLATLFGMFLAAALLGLLYGALHRRQLLLVQDDIQLDLDDSRFSFSLPDPAELEDAGLDVGRTAALIEALLVDLDAEADPGRAIRFAYARVEQQLAAVGFARGEAETAHEFLHRALPALGDGDALARLTTLFERARFSETPMTEPTRSDARDALEHLQQQLRDLGERQAALTGESTETGGGARP